ncbi:hypothetical protein XO10_00795 [Marinitoga sp. 1135]|uniref:Lysophospholipase n=1 Tax=Marinitoga piezophila (strain DSM 14283 / JCM 11233 / KA3) TaxID=443254 RepID=H2J336_MARPK|nr:MULTISPECIES: alpha/beta hydrolase [Marinitoga]AEX84554.1 lysophospholipase [Marinitoga piezophila KA3]NUU94853.1 hypothetical protein [Marinitoga sp. 1135]NUU96790.1 hypothetical protein [Marinitoga sp. 1138]
MYLKRFIKDSKPKATFVIVHGLGEHSGRYKPFIEMLLERNFQVITFDLPGHGLSEGKRGHIKDFYKIYEYIEEITPDKFILFGHSLGGLISLRYAEVSEKKPEKLILSSPAVGKLYNSFHKILLSTVGIFGSLTISNGISPSALCYSEEAVEKYINDPLVHNRISMKTAKQLFSEAEKALNSAEKLDIPVLLQYGEEDKIVNINELEKLSQKINTLYLKKHKYAKHEVFNEPKYKDKFYEAIFEFIE